MRQNINEKSIRSFVEYIGAEGGSFHTQKRYEHDVKMFADFLGERKITPKILEEYKAAKLKKNSAATVKTMIFGVNKYLAFICGNNLFVCLNFLRTFCGSYMKKFLPVVI